MKKIAFVIPNKTKELTLSKDCALNCSHCHDHYLQHMYPIEKAVNKDWGEKGITSFLISGGCNMEGAVTLVDHVDILKTLSENHKIVAHTGLLSEEDIHRISPYLDAASFNFIGDDDTIQDIYNLDKNVEDFVTSYRQLKYNVKTYPHITIGLHGGEIRGEKRALDEISKIGAPAVVFNVFIPTPGTEFENTPPPNLDDVRNIISYSQDKMSKVPVYIGCMRPAGKYRDELDKMALELGVERIVMPSRTTVKLAKELKFEIENKEECCVL